MLMFVKVRKATNLTSGSSAGTPSSVEPSRKPVDYWCTVMRRIYKPQGGTFRLKDTSHWQRGCDRTPARAGQDHELKFPILSDVALDKFFLPIAEPHIRSHFGLLGLFAV